MVSKLGGLGTASPWDHVQRHSNPSEGQGKGALKSTGTWGPIISVLGSLGNPNVLGQNGVIYKWQKLRKDW